MKQDFKNNNNCMSTKLTKKEILLSKADQIMNDVCALLKWDEMQYKHNQYEMGIAYLMWYLPCDEYTRKQLEASKLYWNWFKHQWLAYDESWISFKRALTETSLMQRREYYNELHCPHAMAVDVKPNDVVLDSIKKQKSVL